MKNEITPLYRRIDGFECNEVPDGYVIYDHTLGQVHFLNLTAVVVLELCDGQTSVETITKIFQDSFALPASPRADIEACLASLVSRGLIKSWSQSSSEA
jgi:PqqD family protein of HPr-rel-A system